MDGGQRVVHARDLDGGRSGKAETLALVFLRVGQARIDGQDEGGVPVSDASAALGGGGGTHEALARRQPERLVREGREARRLESGPVLGQTAARELQVGLVLARRPIRDADIGLHDCLGLEGAMGAFVVEQIDARIDLATHGVGSHCQLAAHARRPGIPGHGVEGRGAIKRLAEAAGQALACGDADADAREGARAAAHQDGVDVAHPITRLGKHVRAGGDELDVGLAATEVVARGKHLHGAALHARHSAGEHIGRCIKSQNQHVFLPLVIY